MSQFNLPDGATLIDDPKAPAQVPAVSGTLPEGATPLSPEPAIPASEPQQVVEKDSFLERTGDLVQKRIENVERGSELYTEGEISYPQFALYGLGNSFGALADVIGESAFTVISTMLPQQAEDFLKEQIAAGGTKLMDTETATAALEFYRTLSPAQQDLLQNSLETTLGVIPGGQWGKSLVSKAVAQDKAKLSNVVLDTSTAAKQKRASESGLAKNRQFTLNNEDNILNTVLSLGVSGNTKPGEIVARLNREINRLGKDIDRSLLRSRERVTNQTITDNVNARLNEFVTNNPIYETSNLSNQLKKAQEALDAALKNYDGTPRGLLKLRREFDNNINTVFAKDVHAGDSSSREIALQMRNALNDLTQAVAPDEDIRALMRRQHLSLLARENTTRHIAKTTDSNLVKKAIDLAERHPFVVAGALQGGGMLTNIPEGLGLTAAGALAGYGATRAPVLRAAGTTASTAPLGRGLLYGAINEFQNETEQQ